MSRRLLTVREAADDMGRSPEWTRRMMATSIPGARKVNGRWMVPADSLDAWVRDGAQETPPARLAIPPRRLLGGRRAA